VALAYDTVYHGLATVRWPGRFEVLANPRAEAAGDWPAAGGRGAVPVLPESAAAPLLVLDGAHNPHAAASLAETWRERFPRRSCTLVFSAVEGKDLAGILGQLAPLAGRLLLCPIDSPRAAALDRLVGALPEGAPPAEVFDSAGAALEAALAGEAPVLVAGSLFLVGEVRALLGAGPRHSSSQ
jgi:dihydrofolate synthase/folylpolyglutamate synthase